MVGRSATIPSREGWRTCAAAGKWLCMRHAAGQEASQSQGSVHLLSSVFCLISHTAKLHAPGFAAEGVSLYKKAMK